MVFLVLTILIFILFTISMHIVMLRRMVLSSNEIWCIKHGGIVLFFFLLMFLVDVICIITSSICIRLSTTSCYKRIYTEPKNNYSKLCEFSKSLTPILKYDFQKDKSIFNIWIQLRLIILKVYRKLVIFYDNSVCSIRYILSTK